MELVDTELELYRRVDEVLYYVGPYRSCAQSRYA